MKKVCFHSPMLYQFLATMTALTTVFLMGANEAWSSVYIPQLLKGTPIQITNEEGSWIVVFLNVGGFVGATLSPLSDKYGRRWTILLSSIPHLISSLLLAYGNSALAFYLARASAGLAIGVTWSVTPLYLGEIAHPKIRGALGSCAYILTNSGLLFVNVIGSYVSIRTTSFIMMGLVIIFLLTFACMPESPYYLIKINKNEEAKRSLRLLRGCSDVDEEFDRISEAVRRQSEDSRKLLDILRIKSNRKAFLILFVVHNGKQLTGNVPLDAYAQTIFLSITDEISPMYISIFFYTARLMAVFINIFLIDKIGRKHLLMLPLFIIGVTLFLLGIYLYLRLHMSIKFPTPLKWVAICLLLIFTVSYCFLASIPGILLSELFAMNTKALASVSFGMHYFLIALLEIKFFQITKDKFGMDVPIFTFSVSSFLHLIFIYILVFETKGKTLEEIQDHLKNL